MDTESDGFTRFYETTRDDCLRAVFASVGDRQAAEDLVAEAFARAWARWRTVSRHPAPQAWWCGPRSTRGCHGGGGAAGR